VALARADCKRIGAYVRYGTIGLRDGFMSYRRTFLRESGVRRPRMPRLVPSSARRSPSRTLAASSSPRFPAFAAMRACSAAIPSAPMNWFRIVFTARSAKCICSSPTAMLAPSTTRAKLSDSVVSRTQQRPRMRSSGMLKAGFWILNSLVALPAGDVLNDAAGINDRGQIVGLGTFSDGPHAFLLTPNSVPESGSLMIFVGGLTWLAISSVQRHCS
jgi:probable HAF family extracellular repeat protein